MNKIRSLLTSWSFAIRLATFTAVTLVIATIITHPLQSSLETKIAKEYYGKVYLDLERAKRNVLKGESTQSIDKFGAVTLLGWIDDTIAQSWLDSSKTTEEDRAKLILGKRAIEQALPNILQEQILPETKRNELGVLKEAVKLLPTEITQYKPKDWTARLAIWGTIAFLACLWGFGMSLLFGSESESESNSMSTKKTDPLFVAIALLGAILVIWRLEVVIWTNALLIHLS